jgi:hypothetical protein
MRLDDRATDPQSHVHIAGLRRVERLEQPIKVRRVDPGMTTTKLEAMLPRYDRRFPFCHPISPESSPENNAGAMA